MNRAYWDDLAEDYDDAIFSVRDNDTAGLVAGHIARWGNPKHIAADLGCGVGKFTPLLAQNFGRVQACDLSPKLLARARRACRTHANVDFLQTNLGWVAHPFDPVDFVLCVNVLIMADLDARMSAWRAVTAQVKRGGHLLLVTPSVESMHYTQFRRIDWCLRSGLACAEAVSESVPARGSVRDLHQGIRAIKGVRTKHHLREELLVLLRGHHLEVLSIEKLTYPWTIEFSQPPAWLLGPHPWDWLVLARRK
ncbi:MAG: class I SAM-dependent methyltransferase [Cephaloticoccus sp.]|nr:class I SAM-dependent methyltransferase [Cephaloticoccus sp.]MCF7760212.1 class I SAM-dependent methyltransferase [Cephaloticoccus sp.]